MSIHTALQILSPITLGITSSITFAYIFIEDIVTSISSLYSPKVIDSPSHGSRYFITSSATTNPSYSPYSLNKHSYICRSTIEEDGHSKTFDDQTCLLYSLENFKKDQTQTFNFPILPSEDELITSSDEVDSSTHQLLKINNLFYEKIKYSYTNISIVDRDEPTRTHATFYPEFLVNIKDSTNLSSNLISVRSLNKHQRDSTYAISSKTSFKCSIAGSNKKHPCQLYKYRTPLKTNNINHETLKDLDYSTSFNQDFSEDTYYVLNFFDSFKTQKELVNKEITLYEVGYGLKESKILSLTYDQHIFGSFKKWNKHLMYVQQPKKKSFLVKKTNPDTNKIQSADLFNQQGQNYRCKLEEQSVPSSSVPSSTSSLIPNFDNSCKLFDINNLQGDAKIADLSLNKFQKLSTETQKDALGSNNYFKLEIDVNKLYNFETIANPKIKLIPNKKPVTKNAGKHYAELTIVNEWDELEGKLVDTSNLLLVQARKSVNFKQNKDTKLKCKFYSEDPVDCSIYSPQAQLDPLIKVSKTDGIEKLKFNSQSPVSFQESKLIKQKEHFLIDLKKDINISKIEGIQTVFFVYIEDEVLEVPDKRPNKNTKAPEKKKVDERSSTEVSKQEKPIEFQVIKVLRGEVGNNKQLLFIN